MHRQHVEAKLRDRGVNPDTHWPRRPKGMHRRTFERLKAEKKAAFEAEDMKLRMELLWTLMRSAR